MVDSINAENRTERPARSQPSDSLGGNTSLELFSLRLLKNDPFVTISEIRREYAHQSRGREAGWWNVFLILRRNRLLRRRSRFRYAWGRI